MLMMLVYVARARATYTSIISTIGTPFHFSHVEAFDASLKTARFQRITEAIPEPSPCASEVLLMLMMRSS